MIYISEPDVSKQSALARGKTFTQRQMFNFLSRHSISELMVETYETPQVRTGEF
jgi:hypothetical protein